MTRKITEIIIHCTATVEGKDFTVADIDRWHRNLGWDGIGYHWVVYRNGDIRMGRAENRIGAHCLGHNINSIGVAYVGGIAADGKTPKDTRTEAQKAALTLLLRRLKAKHPKAVIHSHSDFAEKACPCFDATHEYQGISNSQ